MEATPETASVLLRRLIDLQGQAFPLSEAEIVACLSSSGQRAPPISTQDILQVIHSCRRVADSFFYGPSGPDALPSDVNTRISYIDGIFNSCQGWKTEKLRWWLENIAAYYSTDGAADFESAAGSPIFLCDMRSACEVEAFVRHGLGVKECWGCKSLKAARVTAVCSRCGEARYCNRECQKQAWRQHKTVCVPRSEADNRC